MITKERIIILLIAAAMFIGIYAVANAETNLFYSGYNDSSTFMESVGFNTAVRNETDEFSMNGSRYRNPTSTKYDFAMKADWNYAGLSSPFVFLSYTKNPTLGNEYVREGAGMAFIPSKAKDLNVFPYKHKVSLALIHESGRSGIVASFRYKIKGSQDKYDFKTVWNYLGYSDSLDFSLGYKLSDNVKLKYTYDYERIDSNTDSRSSTGIEVKL